jgi:hypothetical protein
MEKLNCEHAKRLDLVEYLAFLGHQPQKIRNEDYWYLSPLREEKTASFKVNRNRGIWFDHGIGKGGDLIDFGTLYHNCSVRELLKRLSGYQAHPVLSFPPPIISGNLSGANPHFAGEKKETKDSKIVVLDSRPLVAIELLNYLQKRCIPLEIANRYCKEVDFLLYGKKQTVIGFQNNTGGYELRNENFKGSSSRKDVTFIDNRRDDIAVFEGLFSFLSFCTVNKNLTAPLANCLVLNSLSFFEKSQTRLEWLLKIVLLAKGQLKAVQTRSFAMIHAGTISITSYTIQAQLYETSIMSYVRIDEYWKSFCRTLRIKN